MLLTATGTPAVSPGLLARLTAVDERLGLVWHPLGWWAVTWAWAPNDPRWAHVQQGREAETNAYDVVGQLPPDCSVDEAPAYLERSMRSMGREDVARLADRVRDHNARVTDPVVQQVAEDTVREATTRKKGRRIIVGGA